MMDATAATAGTHELLGMQMRIVAPAGANAGRFSVVEMLAPGGTSTPAHFHSREDELLWILEGRARSLLGREWSELGPGAAIAVPRNTRHAFESLGPAPLRVIVLYSPGGFEDFFIHAGIATRDLRDAEPARIGAELARLATRFGTTLEV